ncbi:tetratricopeptide repeat protein [Clostridium botulinum]|nr:hypothetical protein [Clostridium botulinum]HCL4455213.1 hypothetical protein [Clostridium botulinum]HDK7314199.1 hypothetical protein [Clostridium botulinum]
MVYTLLKMKIREMYLEKKYEECNKKLTDLYREIIRDNQITLAEQNQLIWYYYFYKSNIFKNQNNLKDSLSFCLKSFRYITFKDKFNTEYKGTLFLLANIYKELNKKQKAIKTYEYLLRITKDKQYEMIFENINNLRQNSNVITFTNKQNKKYDSNKENNFKFCCYF